MQEKDTFICSMPSCSYQVSRIFKSLTQSATSCTAGLVCQCNVPNSHVRRVQTFSCMLWLTMTVTVICICWLCFWHVQQLPTMPPMLRTNRSCSISGHTHQQIILSHLICTKHLHQPNSIASRSSGLVPVPFHYALAQLCSSCALPCGLPWCHCITRMCKVCHSCKVGKQPLRFRAQAARQPGGPWML